jgi:hypothetical protein
MARRVAVPLSTTPIIAWRMVSAVVPLTARVHGWGS